MPFRKKSFIVAICPACHNMVDVNGEGGYTVFKTKEEARQLVLQEHGMKSITEFCGCKRRAERKARVGT